MTEIKSNKIEDNHKKYEYDMHFYNFDIFLIANRLDMIRSYWDIS